MGEKMGGRKSRQKGLRVEYLVRDLIRAEGAQSHRIPSSGSAQGFKGDVTFELEGKTGKVESKARKNSFQKVYTCLGLDHTKRCVVNGEPLIISRYFKSMFNNSFDSCVFYPATDSVSEKVYKLKKYLGESDILAIKDDYKPVIFLRFGNAL